MTSTPQSEASLATRLAALAGVALVLFALQNWADGFGFFRVLAYQLFRGDIASPGMAALAYAGTYFTSLAAITLLLCSARRWLRYPAYALVAVTCAAHLTFLVAGSRGFTFHEAALFWSEIELVPDALLFFAGSWLGWLLVSSALVVGAFEIALRRRWIQPIQSPFVWIVALLAIPLNDTLLERTVSKVYQTPLPYRVPHLLAYAWRHQTPYYGPRDPVGLEPSEAPWVDHVVVVMDESVRGDLLGINGGPAQTTPRLAALGDAVRSYGVASSMSNLSSTSNIMLQSGLRPNQVPDQELRALKNPSLFAYYARAGFHTWLLDTQIYSEKPANFLTHFDLEALDGSRYVRLRMRGQPDHAMDFAALDDIERIVRDSERSFIYLLKTGAHFPYENKYPDSERVFEPTLPLGSLDRARPETLNSYLNALRWSVDAFLAELLARLDATGESALIFYTSDHGQSVLEPGPDGTPFRGWPHGLVESPPSEQAMVPLVVLAVGDTARDTLDRHYHPALVGRVSAFELFPSLLRVAGYRAESLRGRYAHSLWDGDAVRGERWFLSGNLFARGGGYRHPLVGTDWHRVPFEVVQRTPLPEAPARLSD